MAGQYTLVRAGGVCSGCGQRSPTTELSVANTIWEFFRSHGSQGAIADDLHVRFPNLGYTTITARIKGLKDAHLLVPHPDGRKRLTRKKRAADVWIAAGEFDPKTYSETPQKSRPKRVLTPEEEVLLNAARAYAENEDAKNEDGLISDLFDSCLAAYPKT
jgi:hypothetical protein